MHQRSAVVALLLLCAASTFAQSAALKPASITAEGLQKLKWIEGSWRGTGGGVPAFFERYTFDGTTLVVESLTDGKVTDTSRFELKNGEFRTGAAGAGSVAIALDDKGITFGNDQPNRGTYRWQRETADMWKAILQWPASGNRAAGERIYTMERVKVLAH